MNASACRAKSADFARVRRECGNSWPKCAAFRRHPTIFNHLEPARFSPAGFSLTDFCRFFCVSLDADAEFEFSSYPHPTAILSIDDRATGGDLGYPVSAALSDGSFLLCTTSVSPMEGAATTKRGAYSPPGGGSEEIKCNTEGLKPVISKTPCEAVQKRGPGHPERHGRRAPEMILGKTSHRRTDKACRAV